MRALTRGVAAPLKEGEPHGLSAEASAVLRRTLHVLCHPASRPHRRGRRPDPGRGFAHGPSRQKVVEKIEIDAPPAKVWAIVGNFGDLSWLPGVAKTEGTGGNTLDQAKRKLTLANGGVIEETLTKYDEAGQSLSYKIDSVDVKILPVNNIPRPSPSRT